MRLFSPNSLHLAAALRRLKDPAVLWTPFGLRSLSKSSTLHNAYNTQHDPPYWRGPIWININFLALAALDHYAKVRLIPAAPFSHAN